MILRILLVLLAVSLLGVASLLGIGAVRWGRANLRALARLNAPTPATASAFYRETELAGLPAPVARYFHAVLCDGQPRVRRAWFEQHGTFLTRESPETWSRFTATEEFVPARRGFVWLARIRMAPGLDAHVRDSYLDGEGRMRGEVLRAIPVVDLGGTPQIAEGALLRYLAEAVWFPTALLPGEGVRWTAIDNSTARATLSDHGTTVWLDFEFAPGGEIVRSHTTSRSHVSKAGTRSLPWGGEYGDYEEHAGMRIPMRAEVAWWIDGRRAPYWRGRTTKVVFEPLSP